MSLWLIRGGSYGEHEDKFINDERVYLTWEDLGTVDMTGIDNYEGIKEAVQKNYPGESSRRLGNWSGQIWAFVVGMKIGDWVVMPRKNKGCIAIAEIISPYKYDATGVVPYRQFREVRWLKTDIPRSNFDQDLLYSFGAFLTVCEIKRNDAEARVRKLVLSGSRTGTGNQTIVSTTADPSNEPVAESEPPIDLEQLAIDGIANLIIRKFKGHGMARLVEAILKAQGFTTYLSPEGPDKGIDILAASGAFGFDKPRICVQVKSGDGQVDRPEFTQLIGAMQTTQADQGLFVSWSGFKSTVEKEVPANFFKVRLWNQSDIVTQLLAVYDQLDNEIKSEIPLKRIWTITSPEE